MAKEKKLRKQVFFEAGKTVADLPSECRTCYGFSNWKGDRNAVAYEIRECSDCLIHDKW